MSLKEEALIRLSSKMVRTLLDKKDSDLFPDLRSKHKAKHYALSSYD